LKISWKTQRPDSTRSAALLLKHALMAARNAGTLGTTTAFEGSILADPLAADLPGISRGRDEF
jgi:hypothetical protein